MIHTDYRECSRYDSSAREWRQCSDSVVSTGSIPQSDSINVASFNVLFGSPSSNPLPIIRTQKRFTRIISTLIPNTNADILGLMEVTADFIEMLLNDTFIRENYYISHTTAQYPKDKHEVILLSKLPFSTVYLKGQTSGKYQFSVFKHEETPAKNFIISAAHLKAYEDRFPTRRDQLTLIDEYIKQELFLQNESIPENIHEAASIAIMENNIVLLGDLNIHMRHEDQYLYDAGFVDLWREIHPNDGGYTWDPVQNSLIRALFPFDNRRMRLDRILIRKGSTLFSPKAMQVLAKESIGIYLNYSDHFMLMVQLSMNKNPKAYKMLYDLNQIVNKESTGFRTIKQTVILRLMLLTALAAGAVAGGVYLHRRSRL